MRNLVQCQMPGGRNLRSRQARNSRDHVQVDIRPARQACSQGKDDRVHSTGHLAAGWVRPQQRHPVTAPGISAQAGTSDCDSSSRPTRAPRIKKNKTLV